MGQRTVYYKPTNGNTLRENFEADYPEFRTWTISANAQSVREYDERVVSVELEFLLKENNTAELKEWNQRIVDLMIYHYLLTYCDIGPGQGRFEIVGPMVSTKRYEKANWLISKTSDTELATIWSYLIHGRSIKDDRPFISPDKENLIGFWDLKDREFLDHKLARFDKGIGDIEGIKYVLSVIDEMRDDKRDLILNVEK
jgi:hypothetical protein